MSDSPQPPGWYYAQGDPPDTQRYWDGSQWQGGPQPVPAAGQAGPGMVGAGGGAALDLASPGSRFLGRLVDFFVLLIPLLIVSVIFGAGAYGIGGGEVSFAAQFGAGLLTTLISLAYEFFFLSQKEGQTIGKKVANVRVVKEDGSALDQNSTIMRLIIPALGIIPILGAFIGFINIVAIVILIFVDKQRQVPHDKIAKTVVVNA